jgi:glycosyltransferase involved in cell wall biosynthesis
VKIIYFAGSVVPSHTANSVHVMRMCEALARLGHDVTLVAKRGAGTDADAHTLYGTSGFACELVKFTNRLSLVRYLRRVHRLCDIELAVGRYPYPLLWLQRRGIPVIYETHEPARGVALWLEKKLVTHPGCRRLVVITHALKAEYDRLGVRARSVRVLPDAAVDPGEPQRSPSGEQFCIGFAGSWYAGRGIQVVHHLATVFPEHSFLAAGGGEAELATLGLVPLPNLRCPGFVPHSQVPTLLAGCDLLLAPYQDRIAVSGNRGNTARWCSPMKLFEYMAQGKAIVCSDLPVFHEVLRHRENCLFVAADDRSAWERAIAELVANIELRDALGAAARTQFLEAHTWDRRAAALLDGVT